MGLLPCAVQEGPGFPAALFHQHDFVDDHAAIDRFAHVVNGQQPGTDRGECFHFHAGAATAFFIGESEGSGYENDLAPEKRTP